MQEQISPTTRARAPLTFWLGLCCVFGVCAFYVFLPLANYTDAKDALRYALRIGEGNPYFHPNHLLYEPVVYVLLWGTQALAGPTDPLIVMQWFSTLCAIPFLICVYVLTWRAWQNALLAVLTTGAIGFSFGVWVYSVSPDGYLQPLFLALLALVLLDPQSWRERRESPPRSLLFWAALITAMAVLLHQMYVFFALVTGFVLLFRPEFGTLRQRISSFLIYGCVSGGLVALVYVVVHRLVVPADVGLIDWARGFAKDSLYYDDPPSLMSPVKGAVGAISTMLTMNGLLAFDMIADWLKAAFPTKSLDEEFFIARTAILPWLKVPILCAMIGSVVLWLLMARSAVTDKLRRMRPAGFIDTVLLVSMILYAVLVIIWEPTNREFWIHTYVFATLWCGRQIMRLTPVRRITMGALVACLFFVNFFAALYPMSDPRSDYWRAYNAEAIDRRGEVDLIVTSCTWLCMWYLRYFTGAAVVSPATTEPDLMQTLLEETAPERILISSLAYEPHPLAVVYYERNTNPEWTATFNAAFPPPEPLPSAAQQHFYGFENGAAVLLD